MNFIIYNYVTEEMLNLTVIDRILHKLVICDTILIMIFCVCLHILRLYR